MKYKHIIWDFDGTLFDTYPAMAEAFSRMLSEYGINEPAKAIKSYMKISAGYAKRHYKKLYSLEDGFFERYAILQRKYEIENAKPFDGVVELCHNICKCGGRNYLFTHRGESAQYFIDKFELTEYFTELVTSKYNFPRKPSPEAIQYLISKYGISQKEALMIGDRDLDILSAKNAGIRSCYIMDGEKPLETADVNVDCTTDLFRVLEIG